MGASLSRRDFLKGALGWALRASVAGGAGLVYTTALEPNWVEATAVPVTLARLPAAFHGYRIAQISDLHLGDWLTADHLADVVTGVNALGADLIALTGDCVTSHPAASADALRAQLGRLRAPDGVTAVLGNHDYHTDPSVVPRVLHESGLRLLRNAVQTLTRGGAALHIAGLDDVWWHQDRLDLVQAQLPPAGAAVLLVHEPDFAPQAAATGRFDLQLSGHSHGGQVVIPGVGPERLPPLGQRYPSGRYQVGALTLYTNRGIGMVRPHVRFNCRPEISLFTLQAP